MIRTMRTLLLTFALFTSASHAASAKEVVEVKWGITYSDGQGGQVSSPRPGAAYVARLRACGFTGGDFFPVKLLRCEGVLDFSQSAALRAQAVALIKRAEKNARETNSEYAALRAKIAKVDFALSPFGIFRSHNDGVGEARSMGINVANQRLVILNAFYWQGVKRAQNAAAFLLHETLEAAGYADTDYQKSTAIFEIASGREGHLPKLDGSYDVAKEEGGITVAGQGGDSNQQIFKLSLLAAVDKGKVELAGVEARFLPSKKELRALVFRTPITTVHYFALNKPELCKSLDEKISHRGLCGGFALHGSGGKPFLLMTKEFASSPGRIQSLFLAKIYAQMTADLARDKRGY